MQEFTITKRKLTKVGNSYGILIPKDFVENTDLFKDKEFNVTFNFSKNEIKETEQIKLEEVKQERLFYVSVSQSFQHMVWGEI